MDSVFLSNDGHWLLYFTSTWSCLWWDRPLDSATICRASEASDYENINNILYSRKMIVSAMYAKSADKASILTRPVSICDQLN